jgi:hypothetical protein
MRSQRSSRLAVLAVTGVMLVIAVGCSGNAAATSASDVTPSASVVGPTATRPDPVLAATVKTWTTMTSTLYAHHFTENTKTGVYDFDCVGATSWFLRVAAPKANRELDSAEHVSAGHVPTPTKYAAFFDALPSNGTSTWLPITSPTDLVGGEIIAVPPPAGNTTIAGHALVVAGPAEALTDGGYAVLVYDSTATPHGTEDSRLTDPRNQPLPPRKPGGKPRPSGLGRGTIELRHEPGQQGWFMHWSVGSTNTYGAAVAIARPLA